MRFTVRGAATDGLLDGLQIASTRQLDGDHIEYLAVGDVAMPSLLQRFGPDVDRLIAVERNLPDLESVFLAVTGRELGDPEVDAANAIESER